MPKARFYVSLICGIFSALLIAACANVSYDGVPASSIASSVEEITSEFSASRMIAAPRIRQQPESLTWYEVRLVAVVDKETGEITHSLFSAWEYTRRDQIRFHTVRMPGGIELESRRGRTNVASCSSIGCRYEEVINAVVPFEYLFGDLRVQFLGDRGSYEVTIPANYIEGYLAGVESLLDGEG